MLVSVPAEVFDVAGSVVALVISLEPAVEGILTPLLGARAGGLEAAIGIFLTSDPAPLVDPDKLNTRYDHCREIGISLFPMPVSLRFP